ncbi:C6 transcription factor, putative [Talaromyces stipitatus ATCC 10500]|uniref:C6 transcription factor, putative n=1 Tax=Talaromyces stipitatus (strain ATCC 10500 / CBS 375.48 / QM 6759 / NRRL 1006) TaxID=441959 RepID=B8M1Q9_TALSN|nr:C6 transcription factor, putative [Talaromyces stipitatus ATCC 10500]EED22146.1 C6 transcription factor, putative [Talaromyces stipitatus ATCC 10500]
MPDNRSRVVKRVQYSCDNCRRKKIRCPGEKPACSTCTRLHQTCRYNDAGVISTRSSERLAQLEEKMQLMLEKSASQSNSDHTYTSDQPETRPDLLPSSHPQHILPRNQESQSMEVSSSSESEPLPPRNVILEIVELYFRFCHRQPLWLFEREELSSPEDIAEELVFSLLALTVRFSTTTYFASRSHQQLAQRYGEVARGLTMFRIAQGAVQMSTIQSLCLLAFANFTTMETHLAWFHIYMATSLANMADMNIETHKESSSSSEESRRRLFYSIYILNQTYAPRSMLLNMLDDIENPKYVEPKRDISQESGQVPPLNPKDSISITQTDENGRAGIWTYVVQQASLWREVRGYVAQCADGHPKPPWSPESGYTVIGAHLMNLETSFPTHHRYDAVKFLDRSTTELQQNRDYWSPWLRIQFVYHAIHSMLNHPFLYSSRPHQSVQMSVPNTFWKTSSEQALLHSTWTVRLIDMVWEKDYRVSDPFLGYCAAVAATTHIYYCRASDIRVRTSAQSKLGKCMRFVDELGTVWPVCQAMYDKLDSLVQSALNSESQKDNESSVQRTVSINTGLMWDILDHACGKSTPGSSGRGLFDPSFVQDKSPSRVRLEKRTKRDGQDQQSDGSDTDDVVETQIFHHPNPATDIDTSNGGQEFPPYSGASARRIRSQSNVNQHVTPNVERSTHSAPATERVVVNQNQQEEQQDTSAMITWPADDMWMSASMINVSQDPFLRFQDHDIPWTGSWDVGNL